MNILPSQKLIRFFSRYSVIGDTVFNENAYPVHLEKEVGFCGKKLSMFLYACRKYQVDIISSRDELSKEIIKNWAELNALSAEKTDFNFVIAHDDLPHDSSFYLVFYELKSFLDVFAKLLCKMLNEKVSPVAFKHGVVREKRYAGAGFPDWILKLRVANCRSKQELHDTIIRHSAKWITQAVDFRDTLCHHKEIDGYKPTYYLMPKHAASFDMDLFRLPEMPDGTRTPHYVTAIRECLGVFVDEMLSLMTLRPSSVDTLYRNCKSGLPPDVQFIEK